MLSILWTVLCFASSPKLTSPKTSEHFSIIALSLSFLIEEKSFLTTWTDKWLLSTGVKDCLVERTVKLSIKVRLSQLTVILNSFRKSKPRILSLTSATKNVKGNVRRKEEIEIDNDILPKILIASPLTVLSFVTVGVTKFVLIKLGIIIEVIDPVSAMKSIELSPIFAAMRMQRFPPEVAAHKLGVTSLFDLLENLIETLPRCFWAFVLATDTKVYMILLFEQNRDDNVTFLAFDLL